MKPNMGSTDRVIRSIVAALEVVLFFTNVISGALGIVLMLLAAVFAITSFMSFCPLYTVFRFSTRDTAKRPN